MVTITGCSAFGGGDTSEGQNQTPTQTEGGEMDSQFEVAEINVSSTEVARGTTVDITYFVVNRGEKGAGTVDIRVFGETAASETITLENDETQQSTVEVSTDGVASGEYTCTVATQADELSTSITVLEPATFQINTVEPQQIVVEQGEPASVTVSIANSGEARGSGELVFEVGNKQAHSRNIAIEPGFEREFQHTFDTNSFETGVYDLSVSVGDTSAMTTVSIDPPTPTIETELAVPNPEVVLQDWYQSQSEFAMSIRNRGETGAVGYGVVISEDLVTDPYSHTPTAQSSATISQDETIQREMSVKPDPLVFYYECISWAKRADVTLTNTNDVGGTVTVTLRANGIPITDKTEEIGARGQVTVSFDLEKPDSSNPRFDVEVSNIESSR
jgi:hypothetical protein